MNQMQLSEKQMEYKLSNGDDMKLSFNMVRNYLVTGKKELVNDQELLYFMHECKARRLNPFLRHCWLIKYSQGENAQIVESIHHKREKAMAHPTCEGWEKGIIIKQKDGTIKRSKGLLMPDEELIGAYFTATPKGWKVPYELEINLAGYIKKTREGSITKFWSKENQPSQIMKVAESQGLSALWGGDGAQTIIEEEVQADSEMIDVTPEQEKIADTSEFNALVMVKIDYPDSTLDKFIEETAKAYKTTPDMLKVQAAKDFERFWVSFETWRMKKYQDLKPVEQSSISPDLMAKVNDAFDIDHQTAKNALIEVGVDATGNLNEEQARKFLAIFEKGLVE